MNPMGCQKGASWSHCHYSPDRVTRPLKRVGERGEGQFEEISWDEALSDIADAMLDAIQDQGPASILALFTPEFGAQPARAFTQLLGTPTTDGNAEFQDFSPGWHLTWGLFNPTSSMDDWFLADLTLIWHANPVYINIHWYHYLAECRYNGGDPTITPEMMQNKAAQMAGELGGLGLPMPPAFVWYHQFGYKERWNDPENNDPSMKRSFDEYDGGARPVPGLDDPPR